MNIKAAKKLLEKYKNITIDELTTIWRKLDDEIQGMDVSSMDVLSEITGFGCTRTCLLCIEARELQVNGEFFCNHCIYSIYDNLSVDMFCVNDTYVAIVDSKNEKELFEAIQNRIKYLEEIIQFYEQ